MNTKNILVGGIGVIALAGGSLGGADQMANPYTDTGQTLEIKADSVIPQSGKIDAVLDKVAPAVTLSKWDGQVGMKVSYKDVKAAGDRAFLTDRMEWKDTKQEVHAFPIKASAGVGEDGGFEIEVVLNEKPDTNVFNFTIDGAQDLDFFYQPELTPEEMQEGTIRPDNVIGSYAVYYKNHKDHIQGQTNYATGKAYHIYRPKATDSNGLETWAVLNYDKGTLSVTVPQDFLDKAVYPVTVDPTFGYTSIGGTQSDINASFSFANTCSGGCYTASSGDTIVSYSMYLSLSSGTSGTVPIAAYTFSGGVPVNRLAAGVSVTDTSATPSWLTTSAVSQSLVAGNSYAVAFAVGTGDPSKRYIDSTGGNQTSLNNVGGLSATWNEITATNQITSLYATYTTAAPPAPPYIGRFINLGGVTVKSGKLITQ